MGLPRDDILDLTLPELDAILREFRYVDAFGSADDTDGANSSPSKASSPRPGTDKDVTLWP